MSKLLLALGQRSARRARDCTALSGKRGSDSKRRPHYEILSVVEEDQFPVCSKVGERASIRTAHISSGEEDTVTIRDDRYVAVIGDDVDQ